MFIWKPHANNEWNTEKEETTKEEKKKQQREIETEEKKNRVSAGLCMPSKGFI